MKKTPTITQFGDHGILIRYPEKIDKKIHQALTQYTHYLADEFSDLIEGFTVAYQESALYLNPEVSVDKAVQLFVEKLGEDDLHEKDPGNKAIIHVPVCYEASFALDLEEIAEKKGMKPSEIIALHIQPHYPVYFIGFSPGFPYLGDMNDKIAYPRKASPRTKVEAGSVGIAGNQTGVYPNASPGGWNIIGRSPLPFFDAQKENPSLLKEGDYIRFEAIDSKTFKKIERQVREGTYTIQKSIYND
jgi:inhibitor of KinA